MRIVVNHLTRMRHPQICVAGLTREGRHVRPVPLENHLVRSHLVASGGLFDIGAVVELGDVEDVGLRPELEDRLFALASARYEFHLEPERFWTFQLKHSRSNLTDIFGPELTLAGSSMTVPLGKGEASLGSLRPSRAPSFHIDQHAKIRGHILHRGATIRLPVTDIRLYQDDHESVHAARMEWLNSQAPAGVLLAVGLGRPYKSPRSTVEEHWLQINSIHPASDPLWRTAPA